MNSFGSREDASLLQNDPLALSSDDEPNENSSDDGDSLNQASSTGDAPY